MADHLQTMLAAVRGLPAVRAQPPLLLGVVRGSWPVQLGESGPAQAPVQRGGSARSSRSGTSSARAACTRAPGSRGRSLWREVAQRKHRRPLYCGDSGESAMGREQRRFATGGSASSAKSVGWIETRGNARVAFELHPSARRCGLGGAAQQCAKVRLYNGLAFNSERQEPVDRMVSPNRRAGCANGIVGCSVQRPARGTEGISGTPGGARLLQWPVRQPHRAETDRGPIHPRNGRWSPNQTGAESPFGSIRDVDESRRLRGRSR